MPRTVKFGAGVFLPQNHVPLFVNFPLSAIIKFCEALLLALHKKKRDFSRSDNTFSDKRRPRMARRTEIDMCSGPLFSKIIRFTLPVMLSGILQLLFNAADTIVVGKYAGSEALAAVGSNGALINILVNLFIGLSVGVNVMVARSFGAADHETIRRTVHTSVTTSVICGIFLAVIGVVFARPLLKLMSTPDNVINLSAIYVQIYFLGTPATLLYNFGAAVLKAAGDSDHPLYYLTASGVLNVILNLILVIRFHMSVSGVAIATVVSQYLSAALTIRHLMRMDGPARLDLRRLRLETDILRQIVRIGLPAGLQGCCFSLSNILIQSSVNSFGSYAMAGNSASANIGGFIHAALVSYDQPAINFTSQNRGARQYRRTTRVLVYCVLLTLVTGLLLDGIVLRFGSFFLGIYSNDAIVIEYGLLRMRCVLTFYFLYGIMDVMVGYLRGMGYSVMPTVVTLLGVCVFRIIWIYTAFAADRSLSTLYLSYPISWAVTIVAHLICMWITCRKYWFHPDTAES